MILNDDNKPIFFVGPNDRSFFSRLSCFGISVHSLDVIEFNNADFTIYTFNHNYLYDRDVFLVFSLNAPVAKNVMCLCLIVDYLKNNGVRHISLISPSFELGVLEDNRYKSVSLYAKLLYSSGVDCLICPSLPYPSLRDYFNFPVFTLDMPGLFSAYLIKNRELFPNAAAVLLSGTELQTKKLAELSGIPIISSTWNNGLNIDDCEADTFITFLNLVPSMYFDELCRFCMKQCKHLVVFIPCLSFGERFNRYLDYIPDYLRIVTTDVDAHFRPDLFPDEIIEKIDISSELFNGIL